VSLVSHTPAQFDERDELSEDWLDDTVGGLRLRRLSVTPLPVTVDERPWASLPLRSLSQGADAYVG
jgi:hypothetical protein